jgi:branched-subunit amino acid ABC-type transport system permease component
MGSTLQVVISGLTSGAIYALVALSYNVIFGASGVLNFAQGALLMTGSVTGAMLLGDYGWPVPAALLIAIAVGAALGAVEELVAVRPATSKGASAIGWVVATLGFAIVLQAAFAILFGADARAFPTLFDESPWRIAGAVFTAQQVMLVVVALAVGIALHQFYKRTRVGWALTAIAHDREAAAMRGIPVDRLALAAFAAGGGLAAMTGFLAGPLIGASPSMGFTYALSGFVAAAAGGIPDVRGAVVGGFALGLMEAVGVDIFGAGYRDVVVFGVLIVVLMVRPHGLFGRGAVRTV